jgi:hypothetical protein
MKMTPVCRLDLGQTRVAGFTLFDPKSKEFRECTPKEVRQLILAGQVNGLKLCEDEIVLDRDGFNMQNLKIKSGVGNYRNMFPSEHEDGKFYAVVRLIDTDDVRLFEVVDNKCSRVKMDAAKLMMLAAFSSVAGVRIQDNEIELCDGVIYEDRRSELTESDLDKLFNGDEVVDFEGRLVKISELKELTQLDSAEALAGPAEDVSTIAPAESDLNQLADNTVQSAASNNQLIAGDAAELIETENQSKQQLNQSEAASEELLDAGLCDNLPEKEEPVIENNEQSISEEKQSLEAGIETAGMNNDKESDVERKTNNKKTSGKTKAK